MPRKSRVAPGGFIYHVLNRGVGKTKLFRSRKDYEAFQRCLIHTSQNAPMRVLGYCVMPNHWHLLLWPAKHGDLARFMMRLTNTHVRRWLTAHQQVGSGHLYQGRYKSFAVQDDDHLTTVDRYVQRNALRANLVARAEQWPWSGVGQSQLSAAPASDAERIPGPQAVRLAGLAQSPANSSRAGSDPPVYTQKQAPGRFSMVGEKRSGSRMVAARQARPAEKAEGVNERLSLFVFPMPVAKEVTWTEDSDPSFKIFIEHK